MSQHARFRRSGASRNPGATGLDTADYLVRRYDTLRLACVQFLGCGLMLTGMLASHCGNHTGSHQ